MSFANSIKLAGLTTREAIADGFYRVMSGLDENEEALFKSGLAANVVQSMNGNVASGFEAVKQRSLDVVGPMDTTHFITSIRIDVEGDVAESATLTANTLAQHYPRGTGVSDSVKRLLGGSRHVLQMLKDEHDGLWKIEHWAMKTIWMEGDMSVMKPHGP